MIKREVKKEDIEKEPFQLWNSFIDLIALEKFDDLSEIQKVAQLCFWYDSEVNNGGHLQYFENQGISNINETVNALKTVGAIKHSKVLELAFKQYSSKNRNKIKSIIAFIRKAQEDEYSSHDNEFYETIPEITIYLEKYFDKYKDEFVKIV